MSEVYKPQKISGFPEYLPGERRLELQWLDHIRRVFESYGYVNVETPAVEDVNVLQAKGEINKEIYALHRLLAQEGDKDDARLALHFDLTVPLARYVAQHFNDLDFPFKRYACQKVWRGERPQKGRMREFYQCDIDVIGIDNLPLHFDAEMPAVIHEVFQGMDIGKTQILISNRKILLGMLEGSGVDNTAVLQQIDKLEKIGKDKVAAELHTLGAEELTQQLLDIVETKDIAKINAANATMEEGLKELSFIMNSLKHLGDAIVADLSITRGLDYYTGTVYETKLVDMPEIGSVCSGGRYDDLAGRFIKKKLPGVGISIGLSRLFDVLLDAGKLQPLAASPTDILVALPSEERRQEAADVAALLRQRNNVELFHNADVKKCFIYAEKKGIDFVWFMAGGDRSHHSVKNLKTGEQTQADPANFKASSI